MKKVVVALSLLPLLLLTLAAKPKPVDPAAYEIAVSIQPVDDSNYQLLPYHWRNAFSCTATVSDVVTGAPQAIVSTVVQPGRRGTEMETVNGLTVMFGVEIDANRDGAMTEVVLKRGDQLLLRQRSTTRFAPVQRFFRRQR